MVFVPKPVLQINILNFKFFKSNGECHGLSKILTNHNGALSGSSLHFDWLKVWKAGAQVLPKNLQFNRLICKKV